MALDHNQSSTKDIHAPSHQSFFSILLFAKFEMVPFELRSDNLFLADFAKPAVLFDIKYHQTIGLGQGSKTNSAPFFHLNFFLMILSYKG